MKAKTQKNKSKIQLKSLIDCEDEMNHFHHAKIMEASKIRLLNIKK